MIPKSSVPRLPRSAACSVLPLLPRVLQNPCKSEVQVPAGTIDSSGACVRAAAMLVALAWTSLAFGGEIHDAAEKGNLEKAKALLKDNPALVFSKDREGRTPLLLAVNYREFGFYEHKPEHKAVVALLLINKADANAKDKWGGTPLH